MGSPWTASEQLCTFSREYHAGSWIGSWATHDQPVLIGTPRSHCSYFDIVPLLPWPSVVIFGFRSRAQDHLDRCCHVVARRERHLDRPHLITIPPSHRRRSLGSRTENSMWQVGPPRFTWLGLHRVGCRILARSRLSGFYLFYFLPCQLYSTLPDMGNRGRQWAFAP